MGSSEAVGIEALTTGRALALELSSVPTAGATGRIGFGFLGSKGNEQWSNKAKAEKTIKHQERGRMLVGTDSLLPATAIVAWLAPLLPFHC